MCFLHRRSEFLTRLRLGDWKYTARCFTYITSSFQCCSCLYDHLQCRFRLNVTVNTRTFGQHKDLTFAQSKFNSLLNKPDFCHVGCVVLKETIVNTRGGSSLNVLFGKRGHGFRLRGLWPRLLSTNVSSMDDLVWVRRSGWDGNTVLLLTQTCFMWSRWYRNMFTWEWVGLATFLSHFIKDVLQTCNTRFFF